uniref:Uncharacterized protein n=1 Tax=Vitis vinifera TaxID=29760 RepID=A5BWU4_VITVI|nr:hypothetical protein VITISV_040828 [Vitis vinifera]
MARPEEQRLRWTEEEDRMLFECKSRNLDLPWPNIAELAGLSRSGKSCRERWKNHLDPNVKRGNFSQEEDETIIRLHSSHENSWAFIATHLPGRTDNAVKNRWTNHLKNKLIGRSTDHQNIPDPQRKSMMARPQEQRRPWTSEEDNKLIEFKLKYPDRSWPGTAQLAGLDRTDKSCWERWNDHLMRLVITLSPEMTLNL